MSINNLNENGIKGAIDALSNMKRYMVAREQEAQMALAKAESDLNTFRSMQGWADTIMLLLRERRAEIEAEKEVK